MVVIIEGVPGSGKTTTIENLLRLIRFKYPEIEVEYLPELLPETEGSLDDFSFYLRNDLNKSYQMYSKNNKICLSDRFWHSTVVYKCAENNGTTLDCLKKKFNELFSEKMMFEEYIFIYLDINIEKSMDKAAKHEVESGWQDREFVLKTLDLYRILYDNLEFFSPQIKRKMFLDVDKMGYDKIEKIIEEIIVNE